MSEQSEGLQGIVTEPSPPEDTLQVLEESPKPRPDRASLTPEVMPTSTLNTLAAALDVILPPMDGIGASSAEAVRFIDAAAERGVFGAERAMLAQAAAWLEQAALEQSGKSFVDCTGAERHRVLEIAQIDPRKVAWRHFIVLMRVALAGFLCDPNWQGNKDRHGWIHIGRDRPMARSDDGPATRCE